MKNGVFEARRPSYPKSLRVDKNYNQNSSKTQQWLSSSKKLPITDYPISDLGEFDLYVNGTGIKQQAHSEQLYNQCLSDHINDFPTSMGEMYLLSFVFLWVVNQPGATRGDGGHP